MAELSKLVCPDCGTDTFTQDATQVVRQEGYVDAVYGFEEGPEEAEVLDHEDDDPGVVRCDDCGWDFVIEDLIDHARGVRGGRMKPCCGSLGDHHLIHVPEHRSPDASLAGPARPPTWPRGSGLHLARTGSGGTMIRAIRRRNLVYVQRHQDGPRVYILRRRLHHGTTGLAIVGLCAMLRGKARRGILLGLLAMAHDRKDLRRWLAFEVLPELGTEALLTSQSAGLILEPDTNGRSYP